MQSELGAYPESFSWTHPEAGFFTVFTFLNPERHDRRRVHCATRFAVRRRRHSDVRLLSAPTRGDAIRAPDSISCGLSFCFSESTGAQRSADLREAVAAFARAARIESGVAKS